MSFTYQALGADSWPWVKQLLKIKYSEDMKGIVALDEHGEYAAACVLHNWTRNGAYVHLVLDNPLVLRRGFFEEVANYAFGTCERKKLIGVVPGDNAKALKLNKHIGYVELFRVKDWFDDGVDGVILELTKENCRWYSGD